MPILSPFLAIDQVMIKQCNMTVMLDSLSQIDQKLKRAENSRLTGIIQISMILNPF